MKTITRSSHAIEIDGKEYEIRLAPDNSAEVIHRKLPDGRVVIGYLIQDQDCANPCKDCDGVGQIHSLSNRHIDSINRDEALRLLQSDKMVVALSYFEHGLCRWGVQGTMGGMPDFNWDGVSFAGVWVPDDCCRDEIKSRSHRKRITYQKAAQELAAECCESYTDWSNGDCWGVIVVTCKPDGSMIESDECWGFIGSEYAAKEVKGLVDSAT